MFTNQPSNRRRSAFMLIEVVIALTLLGLLTGAVFMVVRGSITIAAEIEQSQRESDSVNRLMELARVTFNTLPSTATLTLKMVQNTEPVIQELTISGSPDCFSFGSKPISLKDTILRIRPYPEQTVDLNNMPLHYLSLSREDIIPQTDDRQTGTRQETTGLYAPDEQGRYWMPLLPDVVSCKWRFYVEKDKTWYEEWSKSQWPDLIEANLVLKDRTRPIRMVYTVPVLTITAGRASSSTNSSNSNQSGSTINSNGGGRGGVGVPPRGGTSGGGRGGSGSSAPPGGGSFSPGAGGGAGGTGGGSGGGR